MRLLQHLDWKEQGYSCHHFNFDVTTDFGQLEEVVRDKIDLNKAKVRVSADLSDEGIDRIKAQEAMEGAMAEDLLGQFEVEMGLKTAETSDIQSAVKSIGPIDNETANVVEADKTTETV